MAGRRAEPHERSRSTATVAVGSESTSPVQLVAPGSQIGERYEIRRLLGVGGFGGVYLAFDRELRREVALKLLRADRTDEATLKRFRREAAIAQDATSPHLVRTYDISVAGGSLYITMEVVEGQTLRQRMASDPLSINETVRIAMETLEGLRMLHSLGIVHRDIKPSNIFMAPDGTVKLGDFGLARYWDGDETQPTPTDAVVGTLEYLAPEQILGQAVDNRSDLYSVGVVLFEMLTGQVPHRGRSSLGTLLTRLKKSAPDPRKHRGEVPSWLARIVGRLMEPASNARYANAEAVLADLGSRRASLSSRRLLRRAGVAALFLVAVLGLWLTVPRFGDRPQYSHLVSLPEGKGVAAIGQRGETLWTLPEADPQLSRVTALVRLSPGKPPVLATIVRERFDYTPEVNQTVSFLHPETGEIVRQVRLKSGASDFGRSFPDRFRPDRLVVQDLNGDGVDEILVTYYHVPEWPFYAVLYEPRGDRSRVVFGGSGHHRAVGIHDLDDDGRAELLFAGINNRLGWHNAVVAVPIKPWVGENLDHPGTGIPSPDRGGEYKYIGVVPWYALLPRGRIEFIGGSITGDPETRTLQVPYEGGRVEEVSFEGFLTEQTSRLSPSQRQELRRGAYQRLLEALRLRDGDFTSAGLAEIRKAETQVQQAALPLLEECLKRFRGRILVAHGSLEEADILFQTLAAESIAASDIAFDAAEAFHLAGELNQALRWYREGTGPGGDNKQGPTKFRYVEGAILVLGELERWQEAEAEVERYSRSYNQKTAEIFHQYVRWRSGSSPRLEDIPINRDDTDRHWYWYLEFRNDHDEDPEVLLAQVEKQFKEAYEVGGPLLSLKAMLLAKLGRNQAALETVRDAFDLVKGEHRRNTLARGHLQLVADRLAMIARNNELEAEAQRTEETVRRLLAPRN